MRFLPLKKSSTQKSYNLAVKRPIRSSNLLPCYCMIVLILLPTTVHVVFCSHLVRPEERQKIYGTWHYSGVSLARHVDLVGLTTGLLDTLLFTLSSLNLRRKLFSSTSFLVPRDALKSLSVSPRQSDYEEIPNFPLFGITSEVSGVSSDTDLSAEEGPEDIWI